MDRQAVDRFRDSFKNRNVRSTQYADVLPKECAQGYMVTDTIILDSQIREEPDVSIVDLRILVNDGAAEFLLCKL